MAGGRWAAAVLGVSAIGVAAWALGIDRRAAVSQGGQRAVAEATKAAVDLAEVALRDRDAEATAAASVPQLKAALRNRVDAATLEDLFATEDWWAPYRDRAVSIVGRNGLLVSHPARQSPPAADLISRARAGGAVATATNAGGEAVLIGAVVVDGVVGAPVLTLTRPIDALLLGQWARASGSPTAITDGKRLLFASDVEIAAESLAGHEGDAARTFAGRRVAAAAALGSLWLWVVRPVAPVTGGGRSWPWVLAGCLGLGAAALGFARRSQRGAPQERPTAKSVPVAPEQVPPGDPRIRSDVRPSAANLPTLIASGQGLSFGRYTLLDWIGEGGMSEVCTAVLSGAEGFQRIVVLKRLKSDLAHNRVAIDQFIDEAKLGSLLVHSNIVQVLDFGKVDDGYYMALEYISGRNVGQIIERHVERLGEPLDLSVVFYLAHEVLGALAYAHERTDDNGDPLRIVHRDVSPGNIIVSTTGEVKLIDFGIVKAENRVSRTDLGTVKGNAAFMAPEQARGQAVDARADLFSLGLVMYHALTNQLMYEGGTSGEALYQAATGPVSRHLALIAELPAPAARVLGRALAPDPAQRYQSAEEFAADLAAEVRPGAKADLATTLNALFGPELRPLGGATGAMGARSSGLGRHRAG